ncbi:MAG: toxin-antitoxin system YwqK family antitoxin [Flavobacteriales bacterium]|nr:toxin-antitoxin system YwqK family antitoxin [Flavobacteriales bacterium]
MRYLIILSFMTCALDNYSQQADTLYLENSEYEYSVTKPLKPGSNRTIVSYFDRKDRLKQKAEYKKDKMHGKVLYYYDDGVPQLFLFYKKGELHGKITTYHPNGGIEWVKGYKNGALHGERVAWDSRGKLLEGENVFTVPFSEATTVAMCYNGRPDGDFVAKHPDGRIEFAGHHKMGFAHGEFKFYDEKGDLTRTDIYRNGRFIRMKDQ